MRYLLPLMVALLLATPARSQLKPDGPPDSWWNRPLVRACCSVGDAVWADEWSINPDGSITATVTGGGPRDHGWAPVGRTYVIPPEKHLTEPGNPTGRPMLFLRPSDVSHVYCFALGPTI